MRKERVLLGMSGGTDSSVAAILLKEAGYEVIGVTFRFYEKEETNTELLAAQQLAKELSIQHITHDARPLFEEMIITDFIAEYMAGRTPVPCMKCNNLLKWPLLAKLADQEGIHYIASGHYVRKRLFENHYYLLPGADEEKDQSFFLWGLSSDLIARILLPLGDYTKPEIRAIAHARGFKAIATKKDSLGVCFCPMDYRTFLRNRLPAATFTQGRFYDEQGNVLGKHDGYPFYTIGQRRGLGLQLNKPLFVQAIDPTTNRIVLSSLKGLEQCDMFLKEWHFIHLSDIDREDTIYVRVRYRKQENTCSLSLLSDGRMHVLFDQPITAIAPGQSAAFYQNGRLIGGGIIATY
ncbi:MAG: tRNA 2-thiouridine(34) synthase MnmA [Bacteroidaceae bacterium]|nr:tRNA 2-thiouridine(34) synthase MnmA [Bacteroidaceae bacterium]